MNTPNRIALVATVAAASLLGGCVATNAPQGALFTDLNLPLMATSAGGGTKVGTSQCTSILNLLATGDCSVEAAKVAGGIDTVTHVDWKANNILGLFGTYTTTVHGN